MSLPAQGHQQGRSGCSAVGTAPGWTGPLLLSWPCNRMQPCNAVAALLCMLIIRFLRGSAENGRKPKSQKVNLSLTLRVHASSTTSAHHLGKHEAKLATLEIMFRAIRTRKIWPLASPRVVPKSVPNP